MKKYSHIDEIDRMHSTFAYEVPLALGTSVHEAILYQILSKIRHYSGTIDIEHLGRGWFTSNEESIHEYSGLTIEEQKIATDLLLARRLIEVTFVSDGGPVANLTYYRINDKAILEMLGYIWEDCKND